VNSSDKNIFETDRQRQFMCYYYLLRSLKGEESIRMGQAKWETSHRLVTSLKHFSESL
jgi:hypothetical protein